MLVLSIRESATSTGNLTIHWKSRSNKCARTAPTPSSGWQASCARAEDVGQIRVADVHRLLRAHAGAAQGVEEDLTVRFRGVDDGRRDDEVHPARDLVGVEDRQQVAAPVGDDALDQSARPR